MKTYNFIPKKYPLSNISELAWIKCLALGLTEYEKWVLFDFDCEEWADHLDFILGSTTEKLSQYVREQEIQDSQGNYIDEESWNLSK
jgi:hypothetical protein